MTFITPLLGSGSCHSGSWVMIPLERRAQIVRLISTPMALVCTRRKRRSSWAAQRLLAVSSHQRNLTGLPQGFGNQDLTFSGAGTGGDWIHEDHPNLHT